MVKALITGITGQDGSYLSELLLSKGYEVHGLMRRSSSFSTGRIKHLYHDLHEGGKPFFLHYGDLTDASSIMSVVSEIEPDEIYNLGAQSHVAVSFKNPAFTVNSIALGTLNLLESIRCLDKKIRFYNASSSEMFGNSPAPQNEQTRFNPRSPYACAKVFAHHQTINYRESYGIFAANGILFNHESPRRGETFVTRKITRAVARIKLGLQKKLFLGNLGAKRDWGFAGDYVEAMYEILHQEDPSDFVIATGETHSVEEFCKDAFECVGLEWSNYVEIDSRYFRPSEVNTLQGNCSKAKRFLNWRPKTTFKQLVKMMVDSDMEAVKNDASK